MTLPDGPRGRLLAAMLTLSVLAALWFGLAAPLMQLYADRGEQLAQRQALLLRMRTLAESLPALEQRPADRATAASLLAGSTDALAAAAMQSAVQGMAAAAGLEFASMETLPAEARGAYRRIALRLTVSAPWPRLIELLHAAARNQPRMLVDELQLRAPPMQEKAAEVPIHASFTLLAFRAAPTGSGS